METLNEEKDTNRKLKTKKPQQKHSKLFVKKYKPIIEGKITLPIVNEEEKEIDELETYSNVMRGICSKTSAVRTSENI